MCLRRNSGVLCLQSENEQREKQERMVTSKSTPPLTPVNVTEYPDVPQNEKQRRRSYCNA
jgi:hypothetical protein